MSEQEMVQESLTVEQLSELVGRPVKDLADFTKHYTNLKSFVGGGIKEAAEEVVNEETAKELAEAKQKLEETQNWLKDAGIDVKKVNPFELSKVAKAITSTTDVAPKQSIVNPEAQNLQILVKGAQSGSESSKLDLVKAMMPKIMNVPETFKTQSEANMSNLIKEGQELFRK